jgi:hypothetical protein
MNDGNHGIKREYGNIMPRKMISGKKLTNINRKM